MSTLTHSPSPAASPRAAFHIQSSRHYSPRASPRPYPGNAGSPSKQRMFNAPIPSSAPKQPKEHHVESAQTIAPVPTRFVDAGTQYSPDGYPPTASRTLHRVAGPTEGQPPGSAGSAGAKKRKESTRSESPPLHQMSSAHHAAASSSARLPEPPNEPEPRRDPSTTTTPQQQQQQQQHAAPTAHLPQRSSAADPEPQEARSTHGHSSAPKRSRPDPGTVKLMPRAYETCNPKDLGVLISNMLLELIRLNDRIPLRDGRLTRFHSRAPPGISVADYLQRLIQHATLSPPILLSMVYYIDRLCALYTAFTINSLTVHRFLITAATVAAKGLSDSFWTNPTYARIGGIPVSELATLELEFLQKVQWKIVPRPEVLEEYYRSLVERTQGFELEGEVGEGSESSGSSLDESDDAMVTTGKGGEGGGEEMVVDEPT